ncbi:MAG: DUF2442 domain-containing protein [Spirochaetaceae bacterium]|nr:DUF2442 domain-containing protein [Spirochaetaceae bacterium]
MIATTSRHSVDGLRFEGEEMMITIDGQTFRFPLSQISERLLNATLSQRQRFEISASGYGIHWPEVDEDLSVEGLLRASE